MYEIKKQISAFHKGEKKSVTEICILTTWNLTFQLQQAKSKKESRHNPNLLQSREETGKNPKVCGKLAQNYIFCKTQRFDTLKLFIRE